MGFTLPALNWAHRTSGYSQYDSIDVSDDVYEDVVRFARTLNRSILELEADDFFDNNAKDILERAAALCPVKPAQLGHVVDPLIHSVYERISDRLLIRRAPITNARVLIVSPHPDDDVISAGGSIGALVDGGCDVHVAYATTGNSAVYTEDVRRHMDFLDRMRRLAPSEDAAQAQAEAAPSIGAIRSVIRETEAVSALEVYGVLSGANAHFLRLPFYDAEGRRPSDADVEAAVALLRELRPAHVFVAADLADPHGTHATVYEIFREAILIAAKDEDAPALAPLDDVAPELAAQLPARPTSVPVSSPLCWLYRGAWLDWAADEASCFVALSRDATERKLLAMWRHESQKQVMPFGGSDNREFYTRALERNTGLAQVLTKLGLPSVYAAEGLVATWQMSAAERHK